MNAAASLRSLVSLGPKNNDHGAALRVGLGVAVPTLALLVLGHPELTIYAVFGAFTGMYGRTETHQLRIRHQAQAACLLITAVTVGVLIAASGADTWVLVAVESVFAGLGSIFSDRFGLRPAGPFFALFALGACASVPLSVAPLTAIGVAALSAACSLAIGFAGWLRSRRWVRGAKRDPLPAYTLGNALSYLIAVAAAGSLSTVIGIGHPIWAMAAAAVPLSATGSADRLRRGVHRIIGTLLGLLVAAGILLPFGSIDPVVLVLLVVALQFPTELFMTRNYGLALAFFTPLILVMTQLAHPTDPVALIVDRAIETVLGAIVGMAVALAWPALRLVRTARRPDPTAARLP